MLARFCRIRTRPLVRRRGLFSMKTSCGSTSLMIRAKSLQSPECSPSIPALLPALDTSVQGKPPLMSSISPFQGDPQKVVTSPNIGNHSSIPSACRADKTCWQYWLISTAHTNRCPTRMSASNPPPDPEKKCITLSRCNLLELPFVLFQESLERSVCNLSVCSLLHTISSTLVETCRGIIS